MQRTRPYRIGQIVPSSNITMETELPRMFQAREAVEPERFTFHSSRMRMQKVTKEELAQMDKDAVRCAIELSDAHVDLLVYACLVAIMSIGQGYHEISQKTLHNATVKNGAPAPVVTSAGALVETLQMIGAKRISVIAPYVRSLTNLVCDYITFGGVEIIDRIALEIPDNLEVGQRDALLLVDIAKKVNIQGADALVLSACVQMPSLAAIPIVEKNVGIPVISAATCSTFQTLRALGPKTVVPNAGELLSGRYDQVARVV